MGDANQGGFSGDPGTAFTVGGTGGCCGNPPTATITLPDLDHIPVAGGSPCCGTAADARATGACCGAEARADAVGSGAGCCG